MNWTPAHADHAIETVNVIFALAAPIEPDLFDEVLVIARKAAASHQQAPHHLQAWESHEGSCD
jgi:hypothetical protein